MNDNRPKKFMMPFFAEENYDWFPFEKLIVFGRVKNDYQSNCALFGHPNTRSMTAVDVSRLREAGAEVCYVYDTIDFENREFTKEGFKAINADLLRAISDGFTHVLLANAYLIELVCNEYAKDLKMIGSSLLECNSARFKAFFDVMNDDRPVTHVVIPQNHMTPGKFQGLKEAFPDKELIIEVDRWTSDIQMVHEHYYNMAYGYFSKDAITELDRFAKDGAIKQHIKTSEQLWLDDSDLVYKFGEVNVSHRLWKQNVEEGLAGCPRKIEIIDSALWC
ncbi:MAG: hypothetical protein PHW76_10275 [Alphaproteobacteria bacterium]|nr:hypothetical protein [Alphaproteobacteria bacterium]